MRNKIRLLSGRESSLNGGRKILPRILKPLDPHTPFVCNSSFLFFFDTLSFTSTYSKICLFFFAALLLNFRLSTHRDIGLKSRLIVIGDPNDPPPPPPYLAASSSRCADSG